MYHSENLDVHCIGLPKLGLSKAPWTGNIRELRNVVERLVILCGEEVSAEDVKRHVAGL